MLFAVPPCCRFFFLSTSLGIVGEMNGVEKVQRQIRAKTRPLVEFIDELRLNFGFDNVKALTPIVETKLRNGEVPQRPLQVAFEPISTNSNIALIITLPIKFPEESYHIGLKLATSIPVEFAAEHIGLEEEISSAHGASPASAVADIKRIRDKLQNSAYSWLYAPGSEGLSAQAFADVLDDEDVAMENSVDDEEDERTDVDSKQYCCRICSNRLFMSHQVVHGVWNKKCSSVFLSEAPDSLIMPAGDSDVQEGKIYCSKCAARVGAWTWVGSRCSCNAWIVPAFQYVSSKIDAKP